MRGSNKNVVILHGEYRAQSCRKSGVKPAASGEDDLMLNACVQRNGTWCSTTTGLIPCVGTTRMDT